MIGQTISHYHIVERLGSGGMGVVYKAHDTRLDRFVALKFLPHHLATTESERARLLQEARAASSLNHPNVCTIHEIGEDGGEQFIVMEYVEGATLRSKLPYRDLEPAITCALQIGEALSEAHGRGIVHRDVKSENIMVTSQNRAKVMDFGLAKLKGALMPSRGSGIVGTIACMSPEQIQGGNVDARSDIFSFGILLFEMFTGELPFRGEHEAALMYSILHEEPGIPRLSQSVATPQISQIIGRALAKDPSARYQSMKEILDDLNRARPSGQPSEDGKQHAKSIAVLPFENISPDKENEFFSDGLTEEIISNLSKVRGLRVVSRTTVMRYRKSDKSLKQIAQELQVGYILEGSVRKHGNELRMTAQLIQAEEDVHVWAEKYRGTLEDVFDIQEKVAGQITEALKVQLAPDEEEGLRKRHTRVAEAYELYLRGRYWWNKRTEEGFRKAIQYFEQAIEKDPAYAVAYAGLADCHNLLSAYALVAPADASPRAIAAAHNAMRLDARLAEAHEVLAHVGMLFGTTDVNIEDEFRKALSLNPQYATAFQRYAIYLAASDRLDEALPIIKRAQELDPLSLIINADVGLLLYLAKEHDKAAAQFRKTLEIDRSFAVVHFGLGLNYEGEGRIDEAIGEFEQAVSDSGDSVIMRSALGHAYAAANRTRDAEKIVHWLIDRSTEHYVSPYAVGVVYAGLGKEKEARLWLKKTTEQRAEWLIHLHMRRDPRLAHLWSEEKLAPLAERKS